MGRDTLRQLEDEEVRVKQSIRDGKMMISLHAYLWLVQALIRQEKRIRELEKRNVSTRNV